jgi:Xaa-Pro aminopeptidase
MLIKEKLEQAIAILRELDQDCWITFVRESSVLHDPMLDFLIAADVTWQSAFIITRTGLTCAIVGEMDRRSIEDLGIYGRVHGYVQSIRTPLLETLAQIQPRTIALNFSSASEVCDGLTHGMYQLLRGHLAEIGYEGRIVSSERICSILRARKTPGELASIRKAIAHTQEIFGLVAGYIRPGRTERDIAGFMIAEVERRGLGFAWDRGHCPAVFTGPETAGAHYGPTERKVEAGHILNMDFGVKCDNYVSDLQRTFYVLEQSQETAPPPVQKGFDTLVAAIELARRAIRPGVEGIEVDRAAREHIVAQGYDEYPHALGHQVGRYAHDGTALLGPPWEKYARRPYEPLEEGMVFTIEPRLKVPGRGVVTIEDMVIVTRNGAEYVSDPQQTLILVR